MKTVRCKRVTRLALFLAVVVVAGVCRGFAGPRLDRVLETKILRWGLRRLPPLLHAEQETGSTSRY